MYKVKKFNLTEWLKAIAIMLIMMITLSGCVGKKNDSAEVESENNLFIHGLVAVMNDDGKWGYINEQGEMVIEPQFDQAHGFTPNGLAAVGKGVYCGYVNTKGDVAIKMIYDQTEDFAENGLARVKKKGKWGVIDEEGNIVVDFKYDRIEEYMDIGVAAVRLDDKWGLINDKGEQVVEPKYSNMKSCGEGELICVNISEDDELWGYIDATGNEVVFPQFWDAYPFAKNGLAAVRLKKDDSTYFAYIDKTGKVVFDLSRIDVENPNPFSDGGLSYAFPFAPNGLARVGIQDSCVSRMYGYINEKGELVQDVQFFIASNFDENGLAVVSRGEIFKTDYYKMALIDSEGNFVYDGNCRSFTKFVNGYAWVAKKNKSVKIDLEGNEQMTVDGCAVAQFDDGYTIVEKGEKRYCIINTEGQQIGAEYAEIYRTTEGFERDAEHEYLDGYCW